MFRFTIRELVLLTLVVAMGVGWWVDRRALREAVDDATTIARLASGRILGLRSTNLVRLLKKYGADPDAGPRDTPPTVR